MACFSRHDPLQSGRKLLVRLGMHLHRQLQADCHTLGASPHGLVLLHRNSSLPWFILVPTTDQLGLYQVPPVQRVAVEQEWNDLALWVHSRFACDRVNVAAIGNLVPQLHLHVVGRRSDDPLWPGVVWGRELPEGKWSKGDLRSFQSELTRDLWLSELDTK